MKILIVTFVISALACVCYAQTHEIFRRHRHRMEIVPADTIQQVSIVFRHGDKTPLYRYPNDPYFNYTWNNGYSALTPKGSLQEYNLGLKLRQKYSELMNFDNFYSYRNLVVYSSKTERTMMSAQSLLASFMMPPADKNSLPIPWQPVPIYGIPFDRDHVIGVTKKCPKYIKHLIHFIENPPKDYQDLVDNAMHNEHLYDYMTHHTGVNVTNFPMLLIMLDILKTQKDNGLKLPEWTNALSDDKMMQLRERSFGILLEDFDMKRIRAGSLLSDIVRSMKRSQRKTLRPNRKIFMYSGHGLTLAALIRALEIEEQTSSFPDYASALTFELHKNPQLEFDNEVRVYYYENSDVDEPKLIHVPNCASPCSLTEFNDIIRPYLIFNVKHFERICKNVGEHKDLEARQ